MSTPDPSGYFLPVLDVFGEPDVLAAIDPPTGPHALGVYLYLLHRANWTRGIVHVSRAELLDAFRIGRTSLYARLAALRGANDLTLPFLYPLPRLTIGHLSFRLAHHNAIQRARRARRRAPLPVGPPGAPSAPIVPARAEAPPVPHAADATLWRLALETIAAHANANTYQTYYANTAPLGRRDDVLVIGTPHQFTADYLNAAPQLARKALADLTSDLAGVAFEPTGSIGF